MFPNLASSITKFSSFFYWDRAATRKPSTQSQARPAGQRG